MAAASDDACGSREIWRISGSQDARAITLVENRHTTTVRTFGARRDAHHKRSLDGRGSPLCFHRGGYENGHSRTDGCARWNQLRLYDGSDPFGRLVR